MSNQPVKLDGLEINEMEDGFIVYDARTDKIHFLNPPSCFVLEYCNGRHTVEEIAEAMKEAWQLKTSPLEAVQAVVRQLISEGVVREDSC